jgi:hypothetical protein
MLRPAALALALLVTAALAGPAAAKPRTLVVSKERGLVWAAKQLSATGGTIRLRPGSYGRLVIGPRSGRPLRIVGSPGARLGSVLLWRARNVSISHVTVAPVGGDAGIELQGASHVDLDRLRVTAQGTRFRSFVFVAYARDVRIRRSTFSHCGDRSWEFTDCVLLNRGANEVVIENNRFHDCHGCDFVHGRFGHWLTIRGNHFDRALPCHGMSRYRCGHNDLVQLFAGQHLLVAQNHFGVYRWGGAQLYLTDDVDHATIVNNLFIGTDPKLPGYQARMGIIIGANESKRLPLYARVVNNTILTGWKRKDGYVGSIRMSSLYGAVRKWKRPIVANNVIASLETSWRVCAASQRFVGNLVISGSDCRDGNWYGLDLLDTEGRPDATSAVVDSASRRYAPTVDITGRPRDAKPDVGAWEYHAGGMGRSRR